jgi:hypothetical protein
MLIFDNVSVLRPNGVRYLLAGGTRQRHFDGTNSKPHKQLENATTPTRRMHALFGVFDFARLYMF